MLGHGGLFKTKGVGQKILAAAINAPVSVMETAGEGGPWGMALLASYMIHKEEKESLQDYLSGKVFAGSTGTSMDPDAKGCRRIRGLYREIQKRNCNRAVSSRSPDLRKRSRKVRC